MKLSLALTQDCNLACTYCYAGRKLKRDMSLETALKAVDLAFERAPDGEALDIGFFGGEPLLRLDLLREIVAAVEGHPRAAAHPPVFQVTTNGTLLTDPVIEYLGQAGVQVCVSIDGPEGVHDRNRRFRNGRGSFRRVWANLQRARERLERVQVNVVYGPETVAVLPETVAFLLDAGIDLINLNPDVESHWDADAVGRLPAVYARLADQYVARFRAGQEYALNLIDTKLIVFFKGGYAPEDRCSMGEREWGVAPSGNIYPCERLIGEDRGADLCLGNVHFGIDAITLCRVIEGRGNRNPECAACPLRRYCMNWCGCTNYHQSGHTDLTSPMMCSSEKALIQAAQGVLESLQDDALLHHHLMGYVHKEHQRRSRPH